MSQDNKNEEKSEEGKKDKKENPLALLGRPLAVPFVLTVGLIRACVYNQPFFKTCKELEELLLTEKITEATLKCHQYCENIKTYNSCLEGDPKQRVSREGLEESLEALIYNKKLIEQKIFSESYLLERSQDKIYEEYSPYCRSTENCEKKYNKYYAYWLY